LQRIQSSFCFHPPYDAGSRLFDPQLAGGALLDIGIYNLSLSQFAMQAAGQGGVTRHEATGMLAPTGVDQRVEGVLHFAGGARAGFVCALDGCSDNAMGLEGSRGWMRLGPHFSRPERLSWCDAEGRVHEEAFPFLRNGMEYQALACAEALRQGWTEHPDMPAADTLATAGLIDALRNQLGAR
jgi:predicted dehydrogenase